MWKKDDMPDSPATPRAEPTTGFERSAPPRTSGERATIGRSITIRGEVTGDEDLLIQGHVEGSVNLKQHAVTVGAEGEVKADITARVITVEGTVEGNLSAQEQVILRNAARVEGDIVSPRVMLDDGAKFRGSVDMSEPTSSGRPASVSQSAATGARSGAADTSTAKTGSTADDDKSARKEGASHATANVSR